MELLVVIAIIAILGSLLLSRLSRAKQATENAICRNNLRQQALGLAMYVGDFGVYPLYGTAPFSTPNVYRRYWPELLQPYVKDKWPDYDHAKRIRASPGRGIFACPAYNKVHALYQGGDEPFGAYGYNAPEWDTEVLPSGGEVGLFGLSSSIDPLPQQFAPAGNRVGYVRRRLGSLSALFYATRRIVVPQDVGASP